MIKGESNFVEKNVEEMINWSEFHSEKKYYLKIGTLMASLTDGLSGCGVSNKISSFGISKVQLLWEGHKNLHLSPTWFDVC